MPVVPVQLLERASSDSILLCSAFAGLVHNKWAFTRATLGVQTHVRLWKSILSPQWHMVKDYALPELGAELPNSPGSATRAYISAFPGPCPVHCTLYVLCGFQVQRPVKSNSSQVHKVWCGFQPVLTQIFGLLVQHRCLHAKKGDVSCLKMQNSIFTKQSLYRCERAILDGKADDNGEWQCTQVRSKFCNSYILQVSFGKSSKQDRLSYLHCISILKSSLEGTSDIHQVNSLVEQNCQATIN